jgi:hypothetical protein
LSEAPHGGVQSKDLQFPLALNLYHHRTPDARFMNTLTFSLF